MKGLLLKDWYMIKKHCRLYLLLAVVFLVISWFDNASLFYVIYPCLTCGMITVSLMGFDERSGWVRYSGALPYTKAQLVSAKFIVGLLATAAAAAAEGAVQFAKMKVEGTLNMGTLLAFVLAIFVISNASGFLCMPFIFRYGAEKGRIVYLAVFALLAAGSAAVSGIVEAGAALHINPKVFMACLCFGGFAACAVSWALSVAFYKKREV